jgi:hypothetical protein
VVLVDHDLWLVQALCSHCLVLDEGRVTFAGPTAAAVHEYLSAEVPSPSAPGRTRRREGHDVWIDDVAVRGPLGADPVAEAAAELVVEVDVDGPPRDVRWAFALTSPDLMVVVVAEVSPLPTTLHPGRSTLRAQFQHLPLVPGTFDLRVVVLDADSDGVLARFGAEEGPSPFVVTGGEADRTIHQIGQVLLPVEVLWGAA